MNIYIPDTWLREQLDSSVDAETLKEQLSLCGPSIERIETKEGELVYDVEVTTNRVDACSIRGIAREAATILPEFGTDAKLKELDFSSIELELSQPGLEQLDLEISNDPALCHRILAVKISGLQLGSSPDWLQKRLLQVGQRPLNNAIDITNYVMWEIGHPIHVFDYDRLTEKKILVRQALEGESFVTLDNKSYTCQGGEVVFDDGTGTIIDLPGIMGTANTVVTDETTTALLWIESVDAEKIRFASMTHAIRSQAAVLNEKHVDPHLGKTAMLRAIQLCKDITHGTISSTLYDEFPNPSIPVSCELSQEKLDAYMGVTLASEKVVRILTNLGCTVQTTKNGYSIVPPTYRAKDLVIYQDYIEEIARMYGYHNLDSTIMATPIPDNPPAEDFNFEHQIKVWLAGWGATEVYTNSMVSKALALQSGTAIEQHVALANPLNDDLQYMRSSLLPSLSMVLDDNPTKSTTIFEMQHVYLATASQADQEVQLPKELMQLAMMSNQSYVQVKSMLDSLLASCNIEAVVVPAADSDLSAEFASQPQGVIQSSTGQILGRVGQVCYGKQCYPCWLLDVRTLQTLTTKHPQYTPILYTAEILEDLTFTLTEKTALGEVLRTVLSLSDYITDVQLKDVYQQNYTIAIQYQNPDKNISVDEVAPLRKQVVEVVEKQFAASLVGEI